MKEWLCAFSANGPTHVQCRIRCGDSGHDRPLLGTLTMNRDEFLDFARVHREINIAFRPEGPSRETLALADRLIGLGVPVVV